MMTWKPVIQDVRKYHGGGRTDWQNPANFGTGWQSDNPELKHLQSNVASFADRTRWSRGHNLSQSQRDRYAAEKADLMGRAQGMQQQMQEPELASPSAEPRLAPVRSWAPLGDITESNPSLGMGPSPLGSAVAQPHTPPVFNRGYESPRPADFGSPTSGIGSANLGALQVGPLGSDTLSKGTTYNQGGVVDYRNGGPVAGGPPGRDTVPIVARPGGKTKAWMENGEFVLPRETTAMIGTPALNNLVVRTTGKPPVQYAQGESYQPPKPYSATQALWDRPQVIDDAVDNALRPPPIVQQPAPDQKPKVVPGTPFQEPVLKGGYMRPQYAGGGLFGGFRTRQEQLDAQEAEALGERKEPAETVEAPPAEEEPEAEPKYNMADIMKEIRKKHPPRPTYQRGGEVLSLEERVQEDMRRQSKYPYPPKIRVVPPIEVPVGSVWEGPPPTSSGSEAFALRPQPSGGASDPILPQANIERAAELAEAIPAAVRAAPYGAALAVDKAVAEMRPWVNAAVQAAKPSVNEVILGTRDAISAAPSVARQVGSQISQAGSRIFSGDYPSAPNMVSSPKPGAQFVREQEALMPAAQGEEAQPTARTPEQPSIAEAARLVTPATRSPVEAQALARAQGVPYVTPPPPSSDLQPATTSPVEAEALRRAPTALRSRQAAPTRKQRPTIPPDMSKRLREPMERQGRVDAASNQDQVIPAGTWAYANTPESIRGSYVGPGGKGTGAVEFYKGTGTGGASAAGFDAETMDAINQRIRSGTMGGGAGPSLNPNAGIDWGASRDYSPKQWQAMSDDKKAEAMTNALKTNLQSTRDLRNAQRARQRLPPVGEANVLGALSSLFSPQSGARRAGGAAKTGPNISDLISALNLQRGIANDQRAAAQDAFQNQISLENVGRERRKEQSAAQDQYAKQVETLLPEFNSIFPWADSTAKLFFQQAGEISPSKPSTAMQALALAYKTLAGSKDILFNLNGVPVTGAQAIQLLEGEEPFDTWMPFDNLSSDNYRALRQRAAQEVQARALRGLAE